MRFYYRAFASEPAPGDSSPAIHRPVIPVFLAGSRARLLFVGLVDTGADQALINAEVAQQVGAKPIKGGTFTMMSPNGTFVVQAARVRLQIQWKRQCHEWTAIVGILDQPWPDAVLGRAGFLEYFDVTFRGDDME